MDGASLSLDDDVDLLAFLRREVGLPVTAVRSLLVSESEMSNIKVKSHEVLNIH